MSEFKDFTVLIVDDNKHNLFVWLIFSQALMSNIRSDKLCEISWFRRSALSGIRQPGKDEGMQRGAHNRD
ncbi:MAG: hypothetical protein GY862_29480, partial [Gammaproteobacteria bacterium]|nr:hypothetical protein [Gammaproteobacteria bacterium]